MSTRRDFLQTTAGALAGLVFVGCDLMAARPARAQGRRREVVVNSEKQLMTLSGIVRRVDVDTRNTVVSTAIAEAKIEYSGLGVVDDVQRPGWLVRILDWVYPF